MADLKQSLEPDGHGVGPLNHHHVLTDQNDPDSTAQKTGAEHLEQGSQLDIQNLVYAEDDKEPDIHLQTWIAVFAMCVLGYVQLVALNGPPLILASIAREVDGVAAQTWIPNCVVFVQAVLCSILSMTSDLFQARKTILVTCTTIAFVGAAIAPGSKSIARLLAAQVLIGFGLAQIPLTFVVPSEILPRKWRPMAQAAINGSASIGSITSPLIIGALTRSSPSSGWRTFYWIEAGIWAASAILILVGYRPPKRHTRLDHLSVWQKLSYLDLIGSALLASGLSLFLTGLGLGGNQYPWTNSRTLATLVIGIVGLIAFTIYEWKGTTTGILNHELFKHDKAAGRTFALCLPLVFIEGIVIFSFTIFYPFLTQALFEQDPFLIAAREAAFWVATLIGTPFFGYMSTKLRSVREALFLGYLFNLGGLIGFATIQPGQNINPLFFAALAGFGFSAILSQVIACVQITAPHAHIATATAVAVVFRAVGSTMFTSIFSAAVTNRLNDYIPSYVAEAAASAGLSNTSIPEFVEALASNQVGKLQGIPGVSPVIIARGVHALQQPYADGVRVVFIIAAPFGALSCILCFFLGDLRSIMSYRVDAPVEELHAKEKRHRDSEKA